MPKGHMVIRSTAVMETGVMAEHIHTFDKDEPIVSMVTFNGRLLIATQFHVYELKDHKLEKLKLVHDPNTPSQPRSRARAK
jgi:hypothetical protein